MELHCLLVISTLTVVVLYFLELGFKFGPFTHALLASDKSIGYLFVEALSYLAKDLLCGFTFLNK